MTAEHLESSAHRIVVVARSLTAGGAAKATGRLIEALRAEARGSLHIETLTGGSPLNGPAEHGGKSPNRLRVLFTHWLVKLFRVPLRLIYGFGNRAPSDYGLVSSGRRKILAETSPSITHLHWVGDGDLSIREIAQLPRPVVWTMHDMWTFLGAERFTSTDSYNDGYRTNHGEPRGRQFVNKVFFSLKKTLWKQPMTLVAPSSWMAERAKISPITSDWPIHVIPNALDTDFWTPGASKQSRASLGLPKDKWVVLFGGVVALGDHNKGADLLESALEHLRACLSPDEADRIHIAVFGPAKRKVKAAGFSLSFLGVLADNEMRDAYRSANVVIVPSRLENLPQVATEAAACGVPVVAFDTCGLPDAIVHEKTGLLVEPFNTELMGKAIARIFWDGELASLMGQAARERAEQLWSYQVVAKQYLALYSSLIDG